MRNGFALAAVVGVIALGLAGLAVLRPPVATPDAKPSPAADVELERRLLEIAAEYVRWGRVDDENRWSPELCLLRPSEARRSAAGPASGHARKIYYLFARDRHAYIDGIRAPQPEGQAIVKEAWEPVEVFAGSPAEGALDRAKEDAGGAYRSRASHEGRTYTTGAKNGLFVMLKRGGAWEYGTVDATGTRVLESGALESCLGCHRDAKPDSLFGLRR